MSSSIWDGDWSANSQKWTPKIKQELGIQENEPEGVFFIAVQDYISHFRCTNINYETTEGGQALKVSSAEHDFSQ